MSDELNKKGLDMYIRDNIKASIFEQILETLLGDVKDYDLLPATERLKIHTLMRHGQKPHIHLAKDC